MSVEIIDQAIELIEGGEKEKGQEMLLTLVERDPDNEDAWLWLAVCTEEHFRKKEYLEKVLVLNPENIKARQALKRLSPVKQPSLDELLSPPDISGVISHASAAEEQQDYEHAYKHYTHVLQVQPDHATAWLGRGRCAAHLNTASFPRMGEAIESICKARELGTANEADINQAALVLAQSMDTYIKDLESLFIDQQEEKYSGMSGAFYKMGYGGSLQQSSVDKISREQNKKFQTLVPSIVEGLSLSWELCKDQPVAACIIAASDKVKGSTVFSSGSKGVFQEKMGSLFARITHEHGELLNKTEKQLFSLWPLIIILLAIVAILIAINWSRW
jgi:tetratricopeptide (TPR) repeat protein